MESVLEHDRLTGRHEVIRLACGRLQYPLLVVLNNRTTTHQVAEEFHSKLNGNPADSTLPVAVFGENIRRH